MSSITTMRDSAEAARLAHNQEAGGSSPPPATNLICRCKWCIERTGKSRYRLGGQWTDDYPFLNKDLTLYDFTDGICPDCLAIEKAKIKGKYG